MAGAEFKAFPDIMTGMGGALIVEDDLTVAPTPTHANVTFHVTVTTHLRDITVTGDATTHNEDQNHYRRLMSAGPSSTALTSTQCR